MRQDERHAECSFVFADKPVTSEEIASLFLALAQQVAVGQAIIIKQRVVACGAQIAAQLAQHAIAEKKGQGTHVAMLHRNKAGGVGCVPRTISAGGMRLSMENGLAFGAQDALCLAYFMRAG